MRKPVVSRTLTETVFTAYMFDEAAAVVETKEMSLITTTAKEATDIKIMKKLKGEGYNVVKVSITSQTDNLYAADLDTFAKIATRIEKEN